MYDRFLVRQWLCAGAGSSLSVCVCVCVCGPSDGSVFVCRAFLSVCLKEAGDKSVFRMQWTFLSKFCYCSPLFHFIFLFLLLLLCSGAFVCFVWERELAIYITTICRGWISSSGGNHCLFFFFCGL